MSAMIAFKSAAKAHPWPFVYFKPVEFACRGSGEIYINVEAAKKLDRLRYEFGKPLHVNSAYRSPEYNARVGGARSSYHIQGRAFDINQRAWNASERYRLFELAQRVGFTGFGLYPSFVHLDTGPERLWHGS